MQDDKEAFIQYLFIINPMAGKKDKTGELKVEISAVMESRGLPYKIAVTTGPMSAEQTVREAAVENLKTGGQLKVIACGGDGTLNEVVCGVVGFENVSVSHYPTGSGNDFIKIFGSGNNRFHDLGSFFDSEEADFDLIELNGRYCVNICSVGLDARISSEMARYKNLPLLSGQGAYYASVAANIIKGIYKPMKIKIGDGEFMDGLFTLICACNGRYYGNSFNPVPEAMPDDGIIDVLLVNKCSRLKVATVINVYKRGGYAELPKLITHYRCRKLTVETPDEVPVNIDGETIRAKNINIKISDRKIRFFYPKGAGWK